MVLVYMVHGNGVMLATHRRQIKHHFGCSYLFGSTVVPASNNNASYSYMKIRNIKHGEVVTMLWVGFVLRLVHQVSRSRQQRTRSFQGNLAMFQTYIARDIKSNYGDEHNKIVTMMKRMSTKIYATHINNKKSESCLTRLDCMAKHHV